MSTRLKVLCLLVGTIAVLALRGKAQAATLFGDRPTFLAALVTSVTDGYDVPPYPGGFQVLSDAAMSAAFGETIYQSTGHSNVNILPGNGIYCAGCNGSFLLTFTATSVGDATGVDAVGVDIVSNSGGPLYYAFVTFADATTQDIALPAGASFLGITSTVKIQSIHFGLSGGGTTTSGSFEIDNLTIGAISNDVTPPTLAVSVAKALLAPATKGLINVGLSSQVSDDSGQPVSLSVTVYSDEDAGAAPYASDYEFSVPVFGGVPTLKLRAERAIGAGANGRVYLVVFTAEDGAGNQTKAAATVVVPLNLTAVHLAALSAEAAAALATWTTTGLPPAGWFTL